MARDAFASTHRAAFWFGMILGVMIRPGEVRRLHVRGRGQLLCGRCSGV